MTKSRAGLVYVSDTAYYHCISRGEGRYPGQSFEHRPV